MEGYFFDDDVEDSFEGFSDYTNAQTQVDRGGQFHLQSAILPVLSQLPEKSVTRFQQRMIRLICDTAGIGEPSYNQIKLFSDYIQYCEDSDYVSLSGEIRFDALKILSRECEVFEELLSEPDMRGDVSRVIMGTAIASPYPNHITGIQRAVYVYNILLSKRLGDEDIKEKKISAVTAGKGTVNDARTLVEYCYDSAGWKLYITRELIGWEKDDHLTLTTPAMLLNISDKIQERFNVQMISEIGNKISPTIYPNWGQVREIVEWGDGVVRALGNEGYGLLASFESLLVSQIIKTEEGGFDQGRFQRNIIADIEEDGLFMIPYVNTLLVKLARMSVFHIAQLHGLYRIWGHPEVDSEAGMKKVGDLLHTTKHADESLEVAGRMTFREVFVTNYFSKHGFYPPMEWDTSESVQSGRVPKSTYYIKGRIESNLQIDTYSIHYNKEGWARMNFKECFPLPTGMNIASFLKDKAVSPNRSDLIDMIVDTNRVTDPFKRRGVLKWLTSQPIDVARLMKAINDCPTGLQKDDCTIGLYPKERELKLQARMFALMSYKMRIYFVMTEEMLSHHVLPYFPQIAMNDNFLEIQKKFVDFTTPMSTQQGKDTVTYIVNIDFKKWNQQMRRSITLGVFTDLGQLFGLPELFNRTYDIFMNSFVYLCNGTFTPRVLNNTLVPQYPLSWEGDQGGKEGLRQKGWTIVSAMDLYGLCKDHHFSFKIIGGGDNQVLVITMPCQAGGLHRTHRRMEQFLHDMDDKMKKRGLPLKIGETWVSSSLFAYNKYMIYRGVQLPSTLKLASRCFHLSNTDLMTIENMMSTLAVTYQSIVSKDFSCLTGWIFSRLNMAYHAHALWAHHPFLGLSIPEILTDQVQLSGVKGKTTFKNQLTRRLFYHMMLLFPRVLGGSGTINLLSLLSRGFPDSLSEWCTYLYKMQGGTDVDLNRLINQILLPTKRSQAQYSRLIEDPTCLSLDSAEIGSGALRNIALEFLEKSDKITNKGFKQFVLLSSKEDVEKIADVLCSGQILIPRELHDIMGSTIHGYMSSILAKIDKSTTINKLGDGTNIVSDIRMTECNWINYCAYRLTVRHGMASDPCPTRTAENWRNESWGKKIIGVTTPHPAAFLIASPGKFHDGCDGNFIMHVNLYRKGVDIPHVGVGPCNPYLGSYTKEKSLGTELSSAYGNESLVRRPIHLQKLIGWRYEKDGAMSKIVRACLASVTDVPGDFFESDPRCVVGDAEHRYKDKATKHEGVINSLYYWSSWMRTLTDSFVNHSRGGKNETLQFQTCMLYINALSAMVNEGSSGPLRYFNRLKVKHVGEVHYHEHCKKCIVPLEEPEERQAAPRQFPPIPTCPSNPYLYLKRENMRFSYSELHDIEEYNACMMSGSILEMYDGRTALSILTGCMLGRTLAGARHNEERITESTWRMIMGKIDVPVCLNGMVNYLIAWKFFKVMVSGARISELETSLESILTQRSSSISSFFDMCMSYPSQLVVLQKWCRSNDTGIALGDIECNAVVHEIIRRIQINSNRTAMKIYKTRGESIDMMERVIRALMRMLYVAAECSECQNYIRQCMKNNIAKRCLCPHEELRAAITSPPLVWPEGIESLSKQVPFFKTRERLRLPRKGHEFIITNINSALSVANISKNCNPIVVDGIQVIHQLSNFPVMYQICAEMCASTRETGDEIYIVDTYDGKLQGMLSRYMVIHGNVSCLRLFRSTRKEYHMMASHMSGREIFYRVEDLEHYSRSGTTMVMECETFDELLYMWSTAGTVNNTYVWQLQVSQLLPTIRWLCSQTTGCRIRTVRLSESVCNIILSRFCRNKNFPCMDLTVVDGLIAEVKDSMSHIQSRLYDTWTVSSGTCERNSLTELVQSIFGQIHTVTENVMATSWRRIVNMSMVLKERQQLSQMHNLLLKYVIIIAHFLNKKEMIDKIMGRRLVMCYPNMILVRERDEDDDTLEMQDVGMYIMGVQTPDVICGGEIFSIVGEYIVYMGAYQPEERAKKRKRLARCLS